MIWFLLRAFFRPALDFGSALGGLTGGISDIVNARNLPTAHYPLPAGFGQADQAFMQALQAISQATDRNTGMIDPTLLHSYSQMLGIDLSGLVTAGAQAGDQYKQLASRAGQFGDASAGMGAQIQNQAFDPQNALHDFTRQGVIDTSRAADTSRGLAMSPYSSGNESTATRNFELDWQNRQLGREVAGAGGANAAYGASMNYGAAQPGATMMGAQAPIQGQTAAYGAPMGFAEQFLGAENAMFAPQAGMATSMAMPYMGISTNAASNQYNQDLTRSMDRAHLMGQGFNQMFTGVPGQPSGMGDPTQWFGYGGGNPFSMASWGSGSAGPTGMGPG